MTTYTIESGVPMPARTRTVVGKEKNVLVTRIKQLTKAEKGASILLDKPEDKLASVNASFSKFLEKHNIKAKRSDFVINRDTSGSGRVRIWKR